MADHVQYYVNINEAHALDSFPDRVQIARPGSVTVDGQGTPIPGALTYIQWQGSQIIPCRFDNSRSFRPDALRAQEVVVNEHILHLPVGVDVRPDDKITLLQPVVRSTNEDFSSGLSGWSGPTVGATKQEVVSGGVKLTLADTTTELLGQTVGTGLTGVLLLVELWVEVSQGAIKLNTPSGVLTITAPAYDEYSIQAAHAGTENDIFITGVTVPAQAFVSRFTAWRYTSNRFFEARKLANASKWDVTTDVLVTEMEFQHSDD